MSWASYLTPAALVAGAIAASLNIYALTAGADFGGGERLLYPQRDR